MEGRGIAPRPSFYMDSLINLIGQKGAIMKRYRIFHIPVMSFYSKALYRDIAHNWKGTCYLYLLLLLALCWLPYMFIFQSGITIFSKQVAPEIVSQLPSISIRDGKASFDVKQPHIVYYPKTGSPIAVFDTTGKLDSPYKIAASIFFTATGIIFERAERNHRRHEEFSFRDIDAFYITPQMITDWLDFMNRYLVFIIYPFALIGSYMFRIIQSLVYAAIGLLFASWLKTKIEYDALVRLSVVAVTPVLIATTVIEIAGVHIPFIWILAFLAAMGYLFFGVRSVAREEMDTNENAGGR
jgi:hypothetical protein